MPYSITFLKHLKNKRDLKKITFTEQLKKTNDESNFKYRNALNDSHSECQIQVEYNEQLV